MKVLMVRVPEINYMEEDKPVERQSYSDVLLPMGILHLGSYVKARVPGISLDYLDLHLQMKSAVDEAGSPLSPDAFTDILRQKLQKTLTETAPPDIVGLNCTMNAFADTFHLCTAKIKEIAPNVILVVGGHYPSSYTKRVAEDIHVDYVVVGEGELPFTELIRNYEQGRLPDEKIVDTREYLENFTSFPPLDYEGIGLENYLRLGPGLGAEEASTVTLLSSRGCPNHCIYCATHNVWSYKFRSRTAEQMVDEIKYLRDQYGATSFVFIEDNFLLDKKRIKQFCQLLIDRGLDVQWYPSSAHVNSLNEGLIQLMARSGCQKLVLAIEAGSPRVQKLIRKNVRLDHAIRVAECIQKEGMACECLLIFGFPGETIEEMQETIQFAKKLKCDWYQMNIAVPLYRTEMYEICKNNNWLSGDDSKTAREGVISTSDFTTEQVEDLMWDANYRLNFLENKAYLSGDYDKAESYFESIAARYPCHFISKYMLLQIYQNRGWTEKASEIARDMKRICNRIPDQVNDLIERYNLDIGLAEEACRHS